MNPASLPLLCDPYTRESLEFSDNALVNPANGKRYPIRDGIPVFLDEQGVTGQNRRYQKLYDRIAPGYDFGERAYRWLLRKSDLRVGYMREVEVIPGGRVLEVSVGTGANAPYLPEDAQFFGLDLSWGMLRRCRRNLTRWKRQAELFHGEAEHLPFRDEVFDCVFHVGGINFFSDKSGALAEMVRVARPGTRLVVVDETEKIVSGMYSQNPLTREEFKGRGAEAYAPVQHLPPGMREVEVQEIYDGKLYRLSFRKPAL